MLAFFFACQSAFDTAGVDRQAQSRLDGSSERARTRWALAAALRVDKCHHLAGELVGALRAALLRQQPGQSVLRERSFGLIEGGAREAEQGGGLGLVRAFDSDLAQHLVLHLHDIAGIEESMTLEQRGVNAFGMTVQGALPFEPLGFGIALGQGGVLSAECVIFYTPLYGGCQGHCLGWEW